MSLQRMFPFEPSKNPGETFEGWATESRQLSVSLRKMLAHRISESGGGYLPRLPTPTARDWKDTGKCPSELARHSPPLAVHAGGKLSPLWVEWLMGWPIGWTDLNPLETDKCQWPQRPPGVS